MKFNYFTTKIPFLGVFSLVFLLASCGSYEYVGYDTDGIYGSDQNRTVETPPQQQQQVETKNDGTYYKNYFSEKSREYEYALEDGEIFTDIDSYEGDYNQEIDSLDYNKSYAGWGQNNSNVTINVVDRGWYNPWGWNSWYYSPRYSWGWNSWGWNVGFGYPYYGYGYGYPYYGYGYGYGYPYYGYGYNGYPSYYNNYYGNYNRRSIAYNAGRRGSYLTRDISGISRANRSSSTSRFFNSNSVRTRSSNQVYDSNRSTRTRSNTRSTTPRNNSTRVTSPRRSSTPKASTPRRSTPQASSSGSSSSNSSGSVSRSSSSSSRSSGSRSSGSSRSSSRRN